MSLPPPHPRPANSTFSPPRTALPSRLLAIAADELEHAFYETGRRILTLYLRDLAEAEVMRLTRDPGQLRDLLTRILADETGAPAITAEGLRLQATRYYPAPRTRDALTTLTAAVRALPDLSGISLPDCCALLKRELNHAIRPESLRSLLRRNSDYHQLCVRRERVRFQSDVIVQILGARHQGKRAAAVKQVTKRTTPKPIVPAPAPAPAPVTRRKSRY